MLNNKPKQLTSTFTFISLWMPPTALLKTVRY